MSIESYYNTQFTPYTLAPDSTYPYDLVETAGTPFMGAIDLMESYAPSSGRKQFADGEVSTIVTYLIVCKSPTPVTIRDIIRQDTHKYIVRAVDPVGLKPGHHTEIMVEEVQ